MAVLESKFLDLVVFWGQIGALVCVGAAIWNVIGLFIHHKKGLGDTLGALSKAGKWMNDLRNREKKGKADELGAGKFQGAAEDLDALLGKTERGVDNESKQAYTATEREQQYRDAMNRTGQRLDQLAALHDKLRAEYEGATGARAEEIKKEIEAVLKEMEERLAQMEQYTKGWRQASDIGSQMEQDIEKKTAREATVVNQADADTVKEMKLITDSIRQAEIEEVDAKKAAETAKTAREQEEAKKIVGILATKIRFEKEQERELAEKRKIYARMKEIDARKKVINQEIGKLDRAKQSYLQSTGNPYTQLNHILDMEKARPGSQRAERTKVLARIKGMNTQLGRFKDDVHKLQAERIKLDAEAEQRILEMKHANQIIDGLTAKIKSIATLLRGRTTQAEADIKRGK